MHMHGLTFSDIIINRSFDLGKAPLHITAPTTGPCTKHSPKFYTPPPDNSTRVSIVLTWGEINNTKRLARLTSYRLLTIIGITNVSHKKCFKCVRSGNPSLSHFHRHTLASWK